MKFFFLLLSPIMSIRDKQAYNLYPSSGQLQIGESKETYDRDGKVLPNIDGGAQYSSMKKRKEMYQPRISDMNDNQPAVISFPNQVMAPMETQQPIVYSPQLIYPHITRRIVVHHGKDFKDFYSKNLKRSQFYADFFNNNPNYLGFIDENYQQSMYPFMESEPPEEQSGFGLI